MRNIMSHNVTCPQLLRMIGFASTYVKLTKEMGIAFDYHMHYTSTIAGKAVIPNIVCEKNRKLSQVCDFFAKFPKKIPVLTNTTTFSLLQPLIWYFETYPSLARDTVGQFIGCWHSSHVHFFGRRSFCIFHVVVLAFLPSLSAGPLS